jgi:hypothetical protein
MRLLNDEFGLWEKDRIVKAFVLGGIVSASIIYIALTESVIVFFAALGLILVCAVLFMDLNMMFHRRFYLSHNIFFFALGFVSSLVANAAGWLPVYLFLLIVVFLLLWFRSFIFKKRKFRKPFSSS